MSDHRDATGRELAREAAAALAVYPPGAVGLA